MQQLPSNKWFDKVKTLTLELTAIPSITDSPEERVFVDKLYAILQRIPYFHANPDCLWLERISGDKKKRSNLYALVKSGTKEESKTVLLSGHYDTVSTEHYGVHEPYALQAEHLKEELLKELEEHPSDDYNLAKEDLQSEDFLPGRGILDMKSGLAVAIALLEQFSETPDSTGNLLFVATPDEEKSSVGMRHVAETLPKTLKRKKLDIKACINLDSTSDQGNGEEGQAIYLGSVGKLLTSMLIVGRETHAGYPLEGINPHMLASYIVPNIESNPDFCDEAEGELSPPPTLLKLTDTKEHYDVTTPKFVWASFNTLTLKRTADEVLEIFIDMAKKSITEAVELLEERAETMGVDFDHKHKIGVGSYQQLIDYCYQHLGDEFIDEFYAYGDELAMNAELDAPTRNRILCEYLWNASGFEGPGAVVCFSSLHYPSVLLTENTEDEKLLLKLLEKVAQSIRDDFTTPVSFRKFFAGISDMSWLGSGQHKDFDDTDTVNSNTPSISLFIEEKEIEIPTINIGPWGRDYHKKLERVHMPYTFEILPELVWRTSLAILEQSGQDS